MVIAISVREIVSFALSSGSIDTRYVSHSRAMQGTVIHKKIQEENLKLIKGYSKEVYLTMDFDFDKFTLKVEGRADGVIEDDGVIVEEIKSTNTNLVYIDENFNELHWAQAKFYAYILCEQKNLKNITVRLIYYCLLNDETKTFEKKYTKDELKEYIDFIIKQFKDIADYNIEWKDRRNGSIDEAGFPFKEYRKGQRELSVAVYNTVREKEKIFIKAPTGIGKTISTIFPVVKALGQDKIDRIFYLTSKTITRTVAEEAFKILRKNKMNIKTITLTAKEKICFKDEPKCNPDDCIYAKDYYDKLKGSLYHILKDNDEFSRTTIEEIAEKYKICPFELSLEIAKWCDAVICDYNYIFDPTAALKYIFEECTDRISILIDEAHNLVPRAREMYSAEIRKSDIYKVKKLMTGKAPKLSGILGKINSIMVSYRRELEDDQIVQKIITSVPKDLSKMLKSFIKEGDEFIAKNQGVEGIDEVMNLYFEINEFLNTLAEVDDCYINYVDTSDRDVIIKLFCIDPSTRIKYKMNAAKSCVLFSATMTPMDYYISLLGGDENSYRMFLKSPFDSSNLDISAVPLSTKYKDRENTIGDIVEIIHDTVSLKKGNYIAFFPSYKYMENAYKLFLEKYDDINVEIQNNDMNEKQREDFLSKFEDKEKNILAFCVMGGIFSEGIDLRGDSLIGTIITGVGLPQVCFEREIIKDYYNNLNGQGYDYSYTYPGMNKVMQSVGRVIRTETDKGVAVLIDDRFFTNKYKMMMPREWENMNFVRDKKELKKKVEEFWKKN